jgi:hypothetical protein
LVTALCPERIDPGLGLLPPRNRSIQLLEMRGAENKPVLPNRQHRFVLRVHSRYCALNAGTSNDSSSARILQYGFQAMPKNSTRMSFL